MGSVRNQSRLQRHVPCIMHHISCIMRHASCIIYHAPCVMHHGSWGMWQCIMCHAPCVVHHVSCTMGHGPWAMCHAPCIAYGGSCSTVNERPRMGNLCGIPLSSRWPIGVVLLCLARSLGFICHDTMVSVCSWESGRRLVSGGRTSVRLS